VAWSDDLAVGDVKLLHYFGEDIVLWRGESGRAHALDAYCLHLGGNLGVKGQVVGEDIECPWHGWTWDGEGCNTLIPYSAQKCKPNLRIRTWPIEERYGCINVWHDLAGRPPQWTTEAIPELDRGGYFDIKADMRVVHRIKAHPQMIAENGADFYHVVKVHGAGEIPSFRTFDFTGHRFNALVEVTYGAGKESTWLTPNGPVTETLEFNLSGIGQGWVVWRGEILPSVQVTNVTPIDDVYSDYWFCMTTARPEGDTSDGPTGVKRKMLDHQMKTIEQDFFTWENMKVLHTPNFAPEEAKHYSALRRWAWQFYPQQLEAEGVGA
jgi:phenylpropionate dioxygenase-like ring-hydroxylating dioxygenase large terminal subunit